jgi:hypothetical protein
VGNCTFPSTVVLDQDVACVGAECNVDLVRSVRVFDARANATVYYAYRPNACVGLAFYEDARTIGARTGPALSLHRVSYMLCADPRTVGAYTACCERNDTRGWSREFYGVAAYPGERATSWMLRRYLRRYLRYLRRCHRHLRRRRYLRGRRGFFRSFFFGDAV